LKKINSSDLQFPEFLPKFVYEYKEIEYLEEELKATIQAEFKKLVKNGPYS